MKTIISTLILATTCLISAQKSNTSILGNLDFYELLNAIPKLQTSPESAFQFVCNKSLHCAGDSQLEIQYNNFNIIKESYTNQLESHLASKAQDFTNEYGVDGYKKLADQNNIVQLMGGMDKIMQMSDSDLEVAAMDAMAYKMSSSKLSPLTETEMQRIMNDSEYAKQMSSKYNNMTSQEIEIMVNKKIATGELDDSKEAYEQRLKDKKNAANIQDINLFISKTTTRLAEAYETCTSKIYQSKNTSGNHEELDSLYEQLFEKIPQLENYVQGKYKDPIKLKELKIEYALKHKKRAIQELSAVQPEYKKLESIINEVISDYNSFLKDKGYMINGKMSSLFNSTNTELSLLQVEQSIIGAIDKLTQISYNEDSLASDYEQVYQLVLSEY